MDNDVLDEWAAWLRAGGRTEATIVQRTGWLRRLARETGTLDHDAMTLAGWLGRHEWGQATRRAARAALRSFYGWAVLAGHVEASPADGLQAVREPAPCPRPIPEAVYAAALAEAEGRAFVAIMLGGSAGLRAGEVAQVHERDMGEDLLGPSLLVHGKGGKDRMVPLGGELVEALGAAFAESPHGWAVPSLNDMTTHVSGARVSRMCRPYLQGHTFHALRHRYASQVYGGSGDILATQRLLGHASPVTTQRYVATDAGRLRSAALLAA